MNTLAQAVRRMVVEGHSDSQEERQDLSSSERQALDQLSLLLDRPARRLADMAGDSTTSIKWTTAPEYVPVQS